MSKKCHKNCLGVHGTARSTVIATETLLIPMNIVSFEKAMYQDAFLTVEFRTNLALCNQPKKG